MVGDRGVLALTFAVYAPTLRYQFVTMIAAKSWRIPPSFLACRSHLLHRTSVGRSYAGGVGKLLPPAVPVVAANQ